jgi:hypothetical protein
MGWFIPTMVTYLNIACFHVTNHSYHGFSFKYLTFNSENRGIKINNNFLYSLQESCLTSYIWWPVYQWWVDLSQQWWLISIASTQRQNSDFFQCTSLDKIYRGWRYKFNVTNHLYHGFPFEYLTFNSENRGIKINNSFPHSLQQSCSTSYIWWPVYHCKF